MNFNEAEYDADLNISNLCAKPRVEKAAKRILEMLSNEW